MTLRYLFAVLRARWLSAALVCLIVAGSITAIIAYQPKTYTATASVLIDIKSPDPIAGMVLQGTASPSYMITQIDVIQSLRVARGVVKSLRLDENQTLLESWRTDAGGIGTFDVWVAQLLRRGLDVRPSRGSNVINVSYTGADPDFAAAVANAFVQAYLATTVDLRVDPAKQYKDFFDDRSKQAREALEQAQAKLNAFERANGLMPTSERIDVEAARLSELSSQLVTLEAAVAESNSRQAQTNQNADRMQEVLSNSVVSGLTSEIARQESSLQELSSKLGDAHPQVIQMRSNIDGLRERLDGATRRASGSVGVNNSVNQTRLAQLRKSIRDQRALVLRMTEQRSAAAVLQREVENAQRAYDGVLARLNQTSLESQSAQTNVSALEFAVPPTYASSLNVTRGSTLALTLGLVLGVLTALVREWRDRRVRSEEELPLLVNQPLIGTVPSFAGVISGRGLLPLARARLLPLRAPSASAAR